MMLMIRLVIQRISWLQISVRVQLLTEVLAALGRNYRVIFRKTFPGPRNISSGRLMRMWIVMAVSDVYWGQRAEARMRILEICV